MPHFEPAPQYTGNDPVGYSHADISDPAPPYEEIKALSLGSKNTDKFEIDQAVLNGTRYCGLSGKSPFCPTYVH